MNTGDHFTKILLLNTETYIKREIFEEIYKDFRGWISNSDEEETSADMQCGCGNGKPNNLLYG